MALFDEIRDRASDMAQIAGKKAEEVYSVAKVKVEISKRQAELRGLYRELGEIVYKNAKSEDEDNEAFEDKIAQIDIVKEALEELTGIKCSIKKLIVCPECGEEIPKESAYCLKCGCEL